MSALRITGTFLDEITWDIPSNNWGEEDWRLDFDAMQSIGIDTVIIIRPGLRDRCIFSSETLGVRVDRDLATFFLEETARRNMSLFFGTYDSGNLFSGTGWDWKLEFETNKRFIKEVWDRFGGYHSFAGWYLSHETCWNRLNMREIYQYMSSFCKDLSPDIPVLISPFYPTAKAVDSKEALSAEIFGKDWRKLLSGISTIDYCAFQDGTAPLDQLEAYLSQAKAFCAELGITLWNNVETFSRDYPIKFPPIDFRELKAKLEISSKYSEKNITFEFSHFMSPHSCYPAAGNLYRRYCEWQVL
jgi:hypothetical protein